MSRWVGVGVAICAVACGGAPPRVGDANLTVTTTGDADAVLDDFAARAAARGCTVEREPKLVVAMCGDKMIALRVYSAQPTKVACRESTEVQCRERYDWIMAAPPK